MWVSALFSKFLKPETTLVKYGFPVSEQHTLNWAWLTDVAMVILEASLVYTTTTIKGDHLKSHAYTYL